MQPDRLPTALAIACGAGAVPETPRPGELNVTEFRVSWPGQLPAEAFAPAPPPVPGSVRVVATAAPGEPLVYRYESVQ